MPLIVTGAGISPERIRFNVRIVNGKYATLECGTLVAFFTLKCNKQPAALLPIWLLIVITQSFSSDK